MGSAASSGGAGLVVSFCGARLRSPWLPRTFAFGEIRAPVCSVSYTGGRGRLRPLDSVGECAQSNRRTGPLTSTMRVLAIGLMIAGTLFVACGTSEAPPTASLEPVATVSTGAPGMAVLPSEATQIPGPTTPTGPPAQAPAPSPAPPQETASLAPPSPPQQPPLQATVQPSPTAKPFPGPTAPSLATEPSPAPPPPSPRASVKIGSSVGDRIPDFEMRLVDGSTVTSTSLLSESRPVFLYFLATW